MVAGFFLAMKKLFSPLRVFTKKIDSAAMEINSARTEDRPVEGSKFNDSPLEKKWTGFVKTWNSNLVADKSTSTIVPEEYFSFDQMLLNVTNPMHIQALPSLMTGLGLLGTFSGLVLGISNLDLNTGHNLLEGIKTLLSGTRLAFSTSLAGLLLAIIWGHLERTFMHEFNLSAHNFMDEINTLFPCSKPEHILVKVYDIIKEEAEENRNVLRPAAQKLLTVSENFISQARESNLKTLSALAEQFVLVLNKNMKDRFFEMGTFLENIEKWNIKTSDQFSQMMENMDIISDKFADISHENTNISKLHAEYLKNLSDAINNAQISQEKINLHMKDSSEYLTKTLDMVEKYNRSMILALDKFESSSQRISQNESDNIQLIRDTWKSVTKDLESTISKATEPIRMNIKSMEEYLEKLEKAGENKEKDIETLAAVLTRAGSDFSDSIDAGVEKYFVNFDSNIDDICRTIATIAHKTAEASTELISAIDKMKDSIERQNAEIDKKIELIARIKNPGLLERLGIK
jgi:hypothetical protein